jgi:glycyl-tRNA synthetase beta chain
VHGHVDHDLLREAPERALHEQVRALANQVEPLVEARRYREALVALATLRDPVDRFFDEVLVMDPDPVLRSNRLALLHSVRELFLGIADISRLDVTSP